MKWSSTDFWHGWIIFLPLFQLGIILILLGRITGIKEDPGIYVTPKGEASPYFLRLGKDIPKEYKFSAVPFKGAFGAVWWPHGLL